ncbi:MAG: Ni/Fe hydrogenase subunit alpha, partial [Gammaproteobacteria bacterium]|nr:Ni/Fe hydrogenase subunit alpha [Gammaproteobacteria bacterium]
VNDEDIVTRANLIVSTTNNNQAMNESIRQVANQYLSGRELNPDLLNQIEVAIRAYDPCLSCATHAMGKMPLEVELGIIKNKQITVIDRISRNAEGLMQQ